MTPGKIIIIMVAIVVMVVGISMVFFYRNNGEDGATSTIWHVGDYVEYSWEMGLPNMTTGGDPYAVARYTITSITSEWITLNLTQSSGGGTVMYYNEYHFPANSTSFLSRTSISGVSNVVGLTYNGTEEISTFFGTLVADHYSQTYQENGETKYIDIWEVNQIFIRMVSYGDDYNIIFEVTGGNLRQL